MVKRKVGLILFLILIFMAPVKADVAPDFGYTRISINLNIETDEDVSDYRFYFDFSGDKREVEIKSPGMTTLPSMGGGVRYSSGALWAVSKTESRQEPIELIKHQFSRTVSFFEAGKQTEPKYRLIRDGNSLKLVKISDESAPNNLTILKNPFLLILIIGAILFSLAAASTGYILFRKVLKKS